MRLQTSLQCESCNLLKFISYIGLKKINKAKNIPLIYDGCRVPEAKCPGAGSIQFLISTQRNSISTHRSGSALLYPSCTDLELQQVYLGRNRQVCKSVCTTSNRSSCSIEISSTEACKKLLQAQIIPRINSRRPVYANKAINQNVYVTNEQTQRCKTSKEKADILCQYSVQLVQDFARSQQNP